MRCSLSYGWTKTRVNLRTYLRSPIVSFVAYCPPTPPCNLPVTSEDFWGVTFLILDLSFEIKFSNSPGPNQALVRYIETVIVSDGHDFGLAVSTDYPFGYTFLQHEDALVTVDNDCKLVKWDQYGDNKEQTDVDDAVAALICAIGPDDCPS